MTDTSSSEDEEELQRLQAVSVTGQDIAAAAAAPSHKKRKRRADDGAHGGMQAGGIVEDKLWKALAKRLDGDLECQPATPADAETHSPAQGAGPPSQDGDTFRLFRRAQPGTPLQLPATSAAGNGALSETEAAPPNRSPQPLTKKQRAKLVAQERRRQRKAAKREAAAAQNAPRRLPPPPAAPVDKIAEALKTGADAAHYVSLAPSGAGASGPAGPSSRAGTAPGSETAGQAGVAAPQLTDRERRKQKRIAKRERRLPAKLEAQEKRKAAKAEKHRKKYAIKQQRKAAKARTAASATAAATNGVQGAAAGGGASVHANSGDASAGACNGAPSAAAPTKGGKGGKRKQIGVRRGKFSKAKVKQRVRARKGQQNAAKK